MTKHFCSQIGWSFFAGTLLLALPVAVRADDFLGANGLLKKLNDIQPTASATGSAPASPKNSAAQFVKDLEAFPSQSTSLQPDEKARQWLDLFDRALKLQAPGGMQVGNFISAARATFTVLPGPEAWPGLQKLVEARAAVEKNNTTVWASLLLIVHTLNNEETKQWADLPALASAKPDSFTAMYRSAMQQTGQDGQADFFLSLGTALSDVSSQPDLVEKFWDTALAGMEQAKATSPNASAMQLDLPDLITLIGEAKAGPLIQRALRLPYQQIDQVNGLATQALARKLALANVDKLHTAPWCLTASLDGAALYQALRKKFPNDSGYQPYAIYDVISLVTQGRADEAAKADINIDLSTLEQATEQAANEGWGPQVYDFVHAYLGMHPDSGLWEFYIDLAAQTNHAADALKFLQDTQARTDLSDAGRRQISEVLYRALLAVDRIDEGVGQLRALIKSEKAQIPGATPASNAASAGGIFSVFSQISQAITVARNGYQSSPAEKVIEWDLNLARVGHLLKQDALEHEGLDDAIQTMQGIPPPQPGTPEYFSDNSGEGEVTNYLIETGRYPQAEKLLIGQIVRQASMTSGGSNFAAVNSYASRDNLTKLALVYYLAERWSDLLTLLQKVPGWGARDLVEIASESASLTRRDTPHLDLMAARALAETGHEDQALPILDYALQEDPGNDAGYALLLEIGKGDLIAKLDGLYQQDQFQPRPLIWKAVVLLRQGKVDEAEKTCKQAISVDPSDGETGKGDRMRVYSVMGDVCEAQKDDKQAAFFRNVIKAIRLSEDADDFYDAGLLTRAITMYGQALDLFSDAYCIQARIARQLAEMGRLDEAAGHYRKAFELMPVSFGRMESHCFGCERAFSGKTAVDIAEKTFTEMMAKDPAKPQIPYLLGYLYMEQERYPEALPNFQKAAQLDPDYINAWKQISEIGEKYDLNPALRDEAVFNLLRLDPAGRHVNPQTGQVRQLDKLWLAEEKVMVATLSVPQTLLPLPASATQTGAGDDTDPMAAMQAALPSGRDPEMQAWLKLQQKGMTLEYGMYFDKKGYKPVQAILANKVLSAAIGFL